MVYGVVEINLSAANALKPVMYPTSSAYHSVPVNYEVCCMHV